MSNNGKTAVVSQNPAPKTAPVVETKSEVNPTPAAPPVPVETPEQIAARLALEAKATADERRRRLMETAASDRIQAALKSDLKGKIKTFRAEYAEFKSRLDALELDVIDALEDKLIGPALFSADGFRSASDAMSGALASLLRFKQSNKLCDASVMVHKSV